MQTTRGTINQLYDNGKTFAIVIDGTKYSGFNNLQNGAKKGDTVSFSWEAGGDQGQYKNIKSKLAVEATTNDAPQPSNVATMPSAPPVVERNGAQVGAAINNAIALGLTEAGEIEAMAQQLLLVGDRLASYRVSYKDEHRKQQRAEGLEAVKESA